MTLADEWFVKGGMAAWSVAMTAITVLWRSNTKLESKMSALQAQLAPGLAAQQMLESCPAKACPYSSHRDDAPRPITSRIMPRPHQHNHPDPQPS